MTPGESGVIIRSRFRGLSWDKKHQGWRVRIYFAGKQRHVGRFECQNAAAHAYDKAAVYLYGSNAITNFGLEACQQDPAEVSAFIVLAKEQAEQEQLARTHHRQHSYAAQRSHYAGYAPAGSMQHHGQQQQQQASPMLQTQQVQMLQQQPQQVQQHFAPGVVAVMDGSFNGAVATSGAYGYTVPVMQQQQQQQVWMPHVQAMVVPQQQGMTAVAAATPQLQQYVLDGPEQDSGPGLSTSSGAAPGSNGYALQAPGMLVAAGGPAGGGSAGGPASFVMLPSQGGQQQQHYIVQQQQHMVLAVGNQQVTQHGQQAQQQQQQAQVMTAVPSMPPSGASTGCNAVGPACGAALAGVPQGSVGPAPLPQPEGGGGAGCSSGGGMAAAAANRGIAGTFVVQDMFQGLTFPASPDALPNNVAAAAVHQPLQQPGAMGSSQALVVTVGSSSCAFLGNRYGGPVSMLASGAAAAECSPTYNSGSSSIVISSSPQLHAAYGFA